MERKNNLTIMEILSRAFYLCKDNFLEILKVVGIYIIPSIVLLVLSFISLFSSIFISLIFSTTSNIENLVAPTIGVGSVLLISIIIIIISLIAGFGSLVIGKILDDANKGNKTSWKDATKYIWHRKWSALGINILMFLMEFGFLLVVIFLSILISVITFGIGAIVMIPIAIAICFIITPLMGLANAVFIVRDLGVSDTIGETFSLLKKGQFWRVIGVLATISGISLGAGLILSVLQLIPLIGWIIGILGQMFIYAYVFAYLNIFVLDMGNKKINEFNL